MMNRLAPLAALLFTLGGAAETPLAGRVAGAPVECISNLETTATVQIVDAQTIAYSRTANRTWISHPQGACTGLQPFRTLVVERRGSQLCRGDRFRTVSATSSVPSGQCQFGSFTPYDKVEPR